MMAERQLVVLHLSLTGRQQIVEGGYSSTFCFLDLTGTFSSLLLFRLFIRLQSAHLFEDFVFSGKSSLLVRGPNHCGGFYTRVAGLFNVSDSLFCDGEPFSSADSSLFMVFT